jgi:hypothetical protein
MSAPQLPGLGSGKVGMELVEIKTTENLEGLDDEELQHLRCVLSHLCCIGKRGDAYSPIELNEADDGVAGDPRDYPWVVLRVKCRARDGWHTLVKFRNILDYFLGGKKRFFGIRGKFLRIRICVEAEFNCKCRG